MIAKIKKELEKNSGKKIHITINGSRNKVENYEGIIKDVYNNIFTIIQDNNEIKSFSYVDVLTKNIKIYYK